jgi:hypothetical protein
MFKVPIDGALCYVDRVGVTRTKKFEVEMCAFLDENGYLWSYQDRVIPCSPKGALVRPDFVFVHPRFVIILEVDENYHRYYDVTCELKRIEKLHENCGQPVLLIRFNPHSREYGKLGMALSRAIRTHTEDLIVRLEGSVGVELIFIGYPSAKVAELRSVMTGDVGWFFPYSVF